MKKIVFLPVFAFIFAFFGGMALAYGKESQNTLYIAVNFDRNYKKTFSKETRSNISDALELDKKHRLQQHFHNTQAMKLALERLPKTIQDALSPYGYYNSSLTQTITKTRYLWTVNYHITPGPRVTLNSLDAPIPASLPANAKKHIEESWPLTIGQPFLTTQYQAAKALLLNTAKDYGYLDATLKTHHASVNLKTHQAAVTIKITLGKRYHYGKTLFKAEDRPSFLKRFLRYQSGKPYLASQLSQTRDGLISSNFFDTVSVNPEPNSTTHDVPVNVILTPPVHQLYTVGAGYGTDTGIRGSLKAQFQRLNDRGHQATFFVRGSAINSAAMLSYSIPGKYPPTDSYTFSGQISQLELNGKADTREITFADHFLRKGWSQTLSLSALRETYDITATTIDFPKTNTFLVIPEYTIEHRYLNKPKRATWGYHIYAQLAGTLKSVVSKTTFFQANIKLSVMRRLFEHQRIVARAELGYTEIKSLANLPLTLQLFTGGAESIRGFSYKSIGPGRMLAVGSLELQQEIYPNYYLAAFVDVGNVGGKEIFHEKPHVGVGPAFVWDSPVGHLEMSLGWAVSTPGHHPMLFQFSLGATI